MDLMDKGPVDLIKGLCRDLGLFGFAYNNMTVCLYLSYFHNKSCNSGLMSLSTVGPELRSLDDCFSPQRP